LIRPQPPILSLACPLPISKSLRKEFVRRGIIRYFTEMAALAAAQ
jgi:hypothetical protein